MDPNADTNVPNIAYEAPCVESVLEAGDVEREVHYAGDITLT